MNHVSPEKDPPKKALADNWLLIGTVTKDPDKLIRINCKELLHHTLIVGQSGSGKSFFVARLIEEILLRTRARVVIVDPNGDFRQLDSPSKDIWTEQSGRFDLLRRHKPAFDTKEHFTEGWKKRRFTYLYPRLSDSGKKKQARPPRTDHSLEHP